MVREIAETRMVRRKKEPYWAAGISSYFPRAPARSGRRGYWKRPRVDILGVKILGYTSASLSSRRARNGVVSEERVVSALLLRRPPPPRLDIDLANARRPPFILPLSGQKTLFSTLARLLARAGERVGWRTGARKRTRKSAHNFLLKREEVVECFQETF